MNNLLEILTNKKLNKTNINVNVEVVI